MQPATYVRKLKGCLSPDLLKPEYRAVNAGNPMYGHCYVAAEACFHALGGHSEWAIRRGKDDAGIIHWWLENRLTGVRFDPTAEQYTSVGRVPPYAVGRKASFLTKAPSARARELMKRIAVCP